MNIHPNLECNETLVATTVGTTPATNTTVTVQGGHTTSISVHQPTNNENIHPPTIEHNNQARQVQLVSEF